MIQQSNKIQRKLEAQENQEEIQLLIVKRSLQKTKKLQVYEYQVSGKTPKYIDNANGFIYKQFSAPEYKFYEMMKQLVLNDDRFALKAYLPQYVGLFNEGQLKGIAQLKKQVQSPSKDIDNNDRNLWIGHIAARNEIKPKENLKFICLRSLTFKYQNPTILDLKLGRKKEKKSNAKFQKSTTNSHCFRINGMIAHLHNGQDYEECFISKYFGQKITVHQIEKYLALFFFNGKSINQQLLQKVILKLQDLIKCFKRFRGVKFISSSLFIAYDADKADNYTINLIDFDKYEDNQNHQEDTNISIGLDNVRQFLTNIRELKDYHQQHLINKQLGIFQKNVLVVPEEVVGKYKLKKNEEEQTVNQ